MSTFNSNKQFQTINCLKWSWVSSLAFDGLEDPKLRWGEVLSSVMRQLDKLLGIRSTRKILSSRILDGGLCGRKGCSVHVCTSQKTFHPIANQVSWNSSLVSFQKCENLRTVPDRLSCSAKRRNPSILEAGLMLVSTGACLGYKILSYHAYAQEFFYIQEMSSARFLFHIGCI